MQNQRTVFIASGIAATLAVAILAVSIAVYLTFEPDSSIQPDDFTAGIDLAIPEPVEIENPSHVWNQSDNYDPLWIQNIEVTDPTRNDYIQKLRDDGVFDGAFRQECYHLLGLREAGKLAEYQEGLARLNEKPVMNTRLKIEAIWRDKKNNRCCIDLIGESGVKMTMFFPLED